MRWISIGLLLLIARLVSAQPGSGLVDTNRTLRPLSLEDSMRMAIEHNLGLQIERYNPQVALYNLAGANAYYEPTFTVRAEQSFRSSPGGFNSSINVVTPPNDTWTEHLNAGIGGRGFYGLRYDLALDLTRTSGTFPNGTNAAGAFIIQDRGFQYRTDAGINVTQPLLRDFWIDADRLTIKVNSKLAKMAQYGYEFLIMDTVNRVQQAYFDLIYTRENIKVQEKALELAQRSLEENKTRVQIGAMAPLEEKQSESQRATALADLILARNQHVTAQNILKSLITDKYTDWHMVEIEPTQKLLAMPEQFNLQDSWNKALSMRPDYSQLKEDLERQNLILKYDYNQLFPALDLLGSYGRNGLDTTSGGAFENIRRGDFPRWSGGAVLTVPLTRTRERNNYKRSKAENAQALLRLKKLEQDIVIQIDDGASRAQGDFQRIQATREAREFAEAALQAEQTKLENGKSTSFVVLELQSRLTAARSAEIKALSDYNKSLADFYFHEGSILERSKVIVTDK